MRGARAKRAFVLLLLGATVAIAAGCGGGGSKTTAQQPFSRYETAMQNLGQTLGAAIIASGNGNISATPATIAHNLHHVQAQLRAAAAKLAKITPPARIRAPHELLIRGVREFADELDGVIAQAKAGKKHAALGSIVTLQGLKDMARASKAIAQAGFVIVLPP